MAEHRTCSRCVMDTTVPDLRFDAEGICNLCHVHDRLDRQFRIAHDRRKREQFDQLVGRIKADGRGREHDCIVPISGGADSSYSLVKAVELGLRPLAYHLDNGWTSDLARDNIARLTSTLGVPLRTVSYPWEQLREAYLASLRASIPEVCLPCLVAVFSLAYRAAEREGIRTILFSNSPATEGIAPLSWSYVDGRYLDSVLRRHGGAAARGAARDFNRLGLSAMAVNAVVRRTRVIMLPLYLEWDDDQIHETLRREVGWVDGGKHADCSYTPFRNHVIHHKFGFDLRRLAPAALVRGGRVARHKALRFFEDNPVVEDREHTALVLDRLGLSREQFEQILAQPPLTFRNYGTYYPLVRRMRPVIRELTRRGMLSEHVYDKFFEC